MRDISFEIAPGEAVALVGANGAGKSTLLKILSRITEPSEGKIRYRGRIGSLLEVGTGFHRQLSGRDNVFLAGAVLGMRHREIAAKFDEIVDFAEVERFIDVPVKHYSSGMYMRLAFAVAAHLETEILLVDEVLAVGDLKFQEKCLGRMDAISRSGRTILFVSHNLAAVRGLCPRAILLDRGRVIRDGPTEETLAHYVGGPSGDTGQPGAARTWEPARDRGKLAMLAAAVRPVSGPDHAPLSTSTPLEVVWDYRCAGTEDRITAALVLRDRRGVVVFDQSSWERPAPLPPGDYRTRCTIPGDLLNAGPYFVSFNFFEGEDRALEVPDALSFHLDDSGAGRHGWQGEGYFPPWHEAATHVL